MIKTLLVTTGAVLMAASALQAAPGVHSFGGGARGSSGLANRPAARQYSSAYRGRGAYAYRGYGGGYGHRYYLGGVPYFYDPFFFGFGYYGFGYPYGYGYGYDNPYAAGYYNGRVTDDQNRNGNDDRSGDLQNATALPKAVQKQLAQRGYYKGGIDGDFGPSSKSALKRFQSDHNLTATGRIDPATMKALGFEDRG